MSHMALYKKLNKNNKIIQFKKNWKKKGVAGRIGVAHGVVRPPQGPNPLKKKIEGFAHGSGRTPPWQLGVVRQPPKAKTHKFFFSAMGWPATPMVAK
jgi:hypothetical protein